MVTPPEWNKRGLTTAETTQMTKLARPMCAYESMLGYHITYSSRTKKEHILVRFQVSTLSLAPVLQCGPAS